MQAWVQAGHAAPDLVARYVPIQLLELYLRDIERESPHTTTPENKKIRVTARRTCHPPLTTLRKYVPVVGIEKGRRNRTTSKKTPQSIHNKRPHRTQSPPMPISIVAQPPAPPSPCFAGWPAPSPSRSPPFSPWLPDEVFESVR